MLRFALWRLTGVLATLIGFAAITWLLDGGVGKALRRGAPLDPLGRTLGNAVTVIGQGAATLPNWLLGADLGAGVSRPWLLLAALVFASALTLASVRVGSRRRRRYVRVVIEPYRGDRATVEALVAMYEALHKRLLRRWWRRVLEGQPSVSLEIHHTSQRCGPISHEHVDEGSRGVSSVWFAATFPRGMEELIQTALRSAYPNCRLRPARLPLAPPPSVLRLKKRYAFIRRAKAIEDFEQRRDPAVNRLVTVMAACDAPAFVQVAMTPAPALFERVAQHLYKRREARLSRERRDHLVVRDRSVLEDSVLRGGLDVQHRPLFFTDLRVIGPSRRVCEQIASELRAAGAESSLVERGTSVRHGLLGIYDRRVQRGEGNPLCAFHRGVFASTELAAVWQLPSTDYATVPVARSAVPVAPAPPGIMRPSGGRGTLRDALGKVSIHEHMRKQNTAVPGTVEQGKSSYLVATVAEDLCRERCAVIVLDPKGDAADAAVSVVAPERTCTLLDLSKPTCGFNPLAVDAPADVIADYVVGALRNLFTDADIRASSDRYLRNAIIAVLAQDKRATLWDAARLLSVGEEGYAYRRAVGARVRALPEFKEISAFFTDELAAQLADARSSTTAKLDAPVNKLARLLNSPSIKRVLLNDSLRIDFDSLIANREVLVVKGALGAMGAGNTAVVMQLLVGMLDAALARQQDLVAEAERVAVALKVDEAPLVLNRGFAETMALKRSAGLETVACWQADAQWIEREVRDQLDALFAHRVYFATASASDARSAATLTMAEFSDTVRPGIEHLSALGHPDVRLHLPIHHAVASWVTNDGRQAPFIAQTIPMHVNRERLALHAARQAQRGGSHRSDLRQPHWATDAPRRVPRSRVVAGAERSAPPSLPDTAAASYQELVELDRAQSVRDVAPIASPVLLEPDDLDLAMLELLGRMRHLLTTQIHRCFNPSRAATTTQRRLKRLADAGLVSRLQFHRRDGGGVPMCYRLSIAGAELLRERGRAVHGEGPQDEATLASMRPSPTPTGARLLRQVRHDVHVAGWALAFARVAECPTASLRGNAASTISPRATTKGRELLALAELRLPGGRTPHQFLRTDPSGVRVEVERFETIRPDAIVELGGESEATDLLIELDDRPARGAAAAKLERYDHFLAGWSLHTSRYGRRGVNALIVFVCRDRGRARECARSADRVLGACRAYAGEYPHNWEYPGREGILFVAERDLHESLRCAYGVPRLPPDVRVVAAGDDPRAGESTAETRELPQGVSTSDRS